MTRTRTRQDGSARREALLDAALSCFARGGVWSTGIEAIRLHAGASPSSVYHLFPDGLADVAGALLERIFAELFAELHARVGTRTSARTAVRALVRGHVDWVLAQPDKARVMYEAVGLKFPERVQARLIASKHASLAPLLVHFAGFIEAGDLPAWSPELLDIVLLGAAHEACRRLLAGADLDPDWLRTQLPSAAWRAISRRPRAG
ncbi:MAG TPA: TetR/AcrR family transcriptional regulator [Polyangiales bacterium]|nr:TetR/AcrR family transcriptional regulator [Polyangiales bacterium]